MTASSSTASEALPKVRLKRTLLWRTIQRAITPFFYSWIRLRVIGMNRIDNTRGGLLLMNHQSYLDPVVAGIRLKRPISYLARDGLFRVPFLGWLLRNTHVLDISQTAFRGSSIRAAVERMEDGYLVGVFPEGARSCGPVKAFNRGFLSLVRRVDLPVYPVGIVGADRAFPRGAFLIRPGRVTVVYGEPLTPDECRRIRESRDDAELTEMVRQRVADCMAMASEPGRT